jgi:hypothetical protein
MTSDSITRVVPFVQNIRARRVPLIIGSPDGRGLNLRVEIPEIWDVVQVVASPDVPVLRIKSAALDALIPRADEVNYVMKLRGIEVLDESRSLAEAGATDGSIFLLTSRRRRPVR